MRLIKIGSDSSCDIVINSDYVSAHHADLTLLDNGEIILEDKNSTNGTFVGKKRINPNQETTVRRGDLIKFADETLVWARVPALENNSKYKSIVNIGSNYRNNIVLNNAAVSRYHAMLKIDKSGKAFIVDNNSKNGTQLNGVRITPGKPVRVRRGDNVLCGGEDISEQLGVFLKPNIPAWTWISAACVALIALVGAALWYFPIIKKTIDPNEFRETVVYLRASYHYNVTLKDNPLSDENKNLLIKQTYSQPYEATAFFLDEYGRLGTNRHVAIPWAEEYRKTELTEKLKQDFQRFIADQLNVPNLDHLDLISKINCLRILNQTRIGKVLIDESKDWLDLKAKLERIKKSDIVIDGEMDYITVGYPGRNYTHEDEFARCYVVCESGNKDVDLAILPLNDKKSPTGVGGVKRFLNPSNSVVEKIEPQKEKYSMWGYPLGLSWNMTNTSLEPNLKETSCSRVPGRYTFEIQANTRGGSSGSPIFNKKGELVGVLSVTLQTTDMTVAVQAKYLKKMYEEEVGESTQQ